MSEFDNQELLFRSQKEAEALSHERYERGLGEVPYVIELERDATRLVFVGVSHSNELNHPQWPMIESTWTDFISSENPLKIAFSEGGKRDLAFTIQEAIAHDGDPGLLTFLAARDGIECVSPDDNRSEEINYMLNRGDVVDEIVAYYSVRQLQQWVRQDRQKDVDWETYLQTTLGYYQRVHDWQGHELSLDYAKMAMRTRLGFEFDPQNIDEQQLEFHSSPYSNPVAAHSSTFRDVSLFSSIRTALDQHKDVFVIYGYGHALTLEPALRKYCN